jgi:23S rRNA maturation-related 3'-5' exoribonuclease YhaM
MIYSALGKSGSPSRTRCALTLRYRDSPRTLNELKTAITAYIRSIAQADLQRVFANKIKRIQAYIDARGRHFKQVHSDFPNALYYQLLLNLLFFQTMYLF